MVTKLLEYEVVGGLDGWTWSFDSLDCKALSQYCFRLLLLFIAVEEYVPPAFGTMFPDVPVPRSGPKFPECGMWEGFVPERGMWEGCLGLAYTGVILPITNHAQIVTPP